jgi:hypothetical protein
VAPSFSQRQLAGAIEGGRFGWRLHAIERLAERGIRQQEVLDAIREGERIEDYPDRQPLPAPLFMGRTAEGRLFTWSRRTTGRPVMDTSSQATCRTRSILGRI